MVRRVFQHKTRYVTRLFNLIVILHAGFFTEQCYFEEIHQPAGTGAGDTITVNLRVKEESPETTNAHKCLLGVLVPDDWEFISATYNGGALGEGVFFESDAWSDSATLAYPPEEFGDGLKWICMLTDTGFIYTDTPSGDAQLRLKVGQREGCFDLAYIATKATQGLLGTGWTALSYPHPIGIPDSGLCVNDDSVTLETDWATDWSNLFKRTDGWTGADGIYSIPLNGFEQYHADSPDSTLFLFSDTFIGSVTNEGLRENASLVNNTLALLRGNRPDKEQIEFLWGSDPSNNPAAVFIPNTPEAGDGDWYWLMDGIAIGDTVYIRDAPGKCFQRV